MSRSQPRAFATLLVLALALAGCIGPSSAAEQPALWREAPTASAAPELVRFNQLLADLTDQLRPALVHVRVRRAAAPKEDEDRPHEGRRATGSGFIIDPGGI